MKDNNEKQEQQKNESVILIMYFKTRVGTKLWYRKYCIQSYRHIKQRMMILMMPHTSNKSERYCDIEYWNIIYQEKPKYIRAYYN